MKSLAEVAIEQLDDLIGQWEKVPMTKYEHDEWKTDHILLVRMKDAIQRLAPKSSTYLSEANSQELLVIGQVAKALRADFAAGFLADIEEVIHANLGYTVEGAFHLAGITAGPPIELIHTVRSEGYIFTPRVTRSS